MINFLTKLLGVIAEFGASLMAFLWARDRAQVEALKQLVERGDAIRKAGELGPRSQSDAIERLRDNTF